MGEKPRCITITFTSLLCVVHVQFSPCVIQETKSTFQEMHFLKLNYFIYCKWIKPLSNKWAKISKLFIDPLYLFKNCPINNISEETGQKLSLTWSKISPLRLTFSHIVLCKSWESSIDRGRVRLFGTAINSDLVFLWSAFLCRVFLRTGHTAGKPSV